MANDIDVAHYQAEQVVQHLAVAKWVWDKAFARKHEGYAEQHLVKCAAALGCDLVKRQTPAEMHAEAIAARVTEDIEWGR